MLLTLKTLKAVESTTDVFISKLYLLSKEEKIIYLNSLSEVIGLLKERPTNKIRFITDWPEQLTIN